MEKNIIKTDYIRFTAGQDDEGRRLDKLIRKILPATPLSKIYSSIRKGLVKVNGKKSTEQYKIKGNDEILIHKTLNTGNFDTKKTKNVDITVETGKNAVTIPPEKYIIFENDYIIAVNKWAGICVQDSKPGVKSLNSVILEYYGKTRSNKSLSFTPGPLHRIDKETTGLVFFSGNLTGAREFSVWIKKHLCRKFYLAVVSGILDTNNEWMEWEDKILKTPGNPRVEISERGLYACSYVKTLGINRGKNISLLMVNIKTGRTHQIRAQCAERKHWIIGDRLYKTTQSVFKDKNLLLHSWFMGFPLDFYNELKLPEFLTASLPEYFTKIILENFGKERLAWILNPPYNEVINGLNAYYIQAD